MNTSDLRLESVRQPLLKSEDVDDSDDIELEDVASPHTDRGQRSVSATSLTG